MIILRVYLPKWDLSISLQIYSKIHSKQIYLDEKIFFSKKKKLLWTALLHEVSSLKSSTGHKFMSGDQNGPWWSTRVVPCNLFISGDQVIVEQMCSSYMWVGDLRWMSVVHVFGLKLSVHCMGPIVRSNMSRRDWMEEYLGRAKREVYHSPVARDTYQARAGSSPPTSRGSLI
jgi:hypothetical protein